MIVTNTPPASALGVPLEPDQVWAREAAQRNQIMFGLNKIHGLRESDVILISDVDEVCLFHWADDYFG